MELSQKKLKRKVQETSKFDVLVVHPVYGFSPADVSRYYSRGLRKLGLRVFDFHANRHLTYHSIAFDNLLRIGAIEKRPEISDVLKNIYLQLVGLVQAIKPSLVLVIHGIAMPDWVLTDFSDICNHNDAKTALVLTESPFDEDDEVKVSKFFDFVYATDLTAKEYLDCIYLGHSYAEGIHTRLPPQYIPKEFLVDVGFIGSFFRERVDVLKPISEDGFSTYYAGVIKDEQVEDSFVGKVRPKITDNKELVRLYNGAKFSANFNRSSVNMEEDSEQISGQDSVTIRMVETMASGGVLLTNETKELEDKFEEGVHYLGFSSSDELLSKIREYSKRPDVLSQVRKNAYSRIREVKRSYMENAQFILKDTNTVQGGN